MDVLDRKLVNLMQTDFPLVPRPYKALGEKIGLSEEEVLARLGRLQEEGIIRRIGAFFDSRKLGYYSTLCALAVPEECVGEVAAVVNGYAGVTHNYLREHAYNMWFTLIVPSKAHATAIQEEIKSRTGLDRLLDLPAVRLFKIRVIFDLDGNGGGAKAYPSQGGKTPGGNAVELSPREKALLRALQADLTLEPAPFARLAEKAASTEEEVLAGIENLLAAGVIRRFGPALRHRRAGFPANAMVVWRVPEEKVEAVGKALAASPQVTHCYQRVPLPEWPYNLFTMVHGPDRGFCHRVAAELAEAVEIKDYELLFSTAELKKSSMRYALDD